MSEPDPFQSYLNLADELFHGQISEIELSAATAQLPVLEQELLKRLAQRAEDFALVTPRRGWAVMQVTDAAAHSLNSNYFIQSLAAWYLGRACNHWAQPRRVNEAISRARRGFKQLNEEGWIAACDWQFNVLSWTKTDFVLSASELQKALVGLQRAAFDEFVPSCRLALAYAQILIGRHQAALENIRISEETYITLGDKLNEARCWLHQASALRRQDHFDEAFEKLERALMVFEKENAITDGAKAHYQIALGHLLKADNLMSAVDHFGKAAELFDATDLDLWRAMCVNNLGSVYLINGQLKLAEDHYQEARPYFVRHDVQGPLADNLNDSGKLNTLLGKAAFSIEQFRQSEAINTKLGSPVSAAIAISNLGEAYGQLGRYQDALYHLERAAEHLASLKIYFRLATCEKYMALIWLQLGQPRNAHDYLDRAAAHYEMTDQKAVLSSVYNYKAAAFFQQGMDADAIECLEQSLDISEKYGMRPQAALAQRILGEALLRVGRKDEARNFLMRARSDFNGMGMMMERAACMNSIGTYYESISDDQGAKDAFEEALKLSGQSFPEIDWRAYVELGNLAESHGDIDLAIQTYRRGVETFTKIRRNFLQPALAGSYLQAPARAFDKIVSVSSKADAAQDALNFIEAGKASTLLRNLSARSAGGGETASQEANTLKAEIELLRNRLRVTFDEGSVLQSALRSRQVRSQLLEKVQQYDALKTRLERRSLNDQGLSDFGNDFDLSVFRNAASQSIRGNWIALDYYVMRDELITAIVTPHDCRVYSQPLPQRFAMALDACDKARQNAARLVRGDLEILGRTLIPSSIIEHLYPNTHLLLAPHRKLHRVPWSALQPDSTNRPLVSICIPVVVPSLQTLNLLWERAGAKQALDRDKGLVVGLSEFDGRYEELPLVKHEITALHAMLGPDGRLLGEKDATWENLSRLKQEGEPDREGSNLARFTWLHIASHFFMDRQTGRLSGIVLGDGDISLDQLRDLSPLPGLVSLSACNSNDAFLYDGDERFDLQTTCFMAGANTVIGTAWPILDQTADKLMRLFYNYYLAGANPGEAAAQAQRKLIRNHVELDSWAGFICAGIP